MNLESARSGAECSSRNEGGVAGCHRLTEKAGGGGQRRPEGQPGTCPPPRSDSFAPMVGSEAPSARTGGAAGQGVRGARAGPRLASRRFGEAPADTHPPTLLRGGRWFEGVFRRQEANRAPRVAPAQGPRPPRAVPPPERPRPPRGGGWMARGLLAATQLPPSWAALCVFHAADRAEGVRGGGPQGNSSLCLARLGGDPLDRTQVGSGPGAPARIHMDGCRERRRLNLAASAFAKRKRMAQPSPRPPLVGGFVMWRAVGNRWSLHAMLRPDLPFLPRPLCAQHTESLLPVLGLSRFLLEK